MGLGLVKRRGRSRFRGLDRAVDIHFHILARFTHGIIIVLALTVDRRRCRGPSFCLLLSLLGRNLLRREETTSRTAGATHSVLMTGFMEIWLQSSSANGDDDKDQTGCTFLCLASL